VSLLESARSGRETITLSYICATATEYVRAGRVLYLDCQDVWVLGSNRPGRDARNHAL